MNEGIYGKHEKERRMPNTLSQGQQEIIALRRSMKYPKKIYIFDEVLSSLDENNRKRLLKRIAEIFKRILVIMASRDTRILDYGKKVEIPLMGESRYSIDEADSEVDLTAVLTDILDR